MDIETETLWRRARQGDREAQTALVEIHLPLVFQAVSRLSIRVRRKTERDELVGSGVVGLHDAVAHFDTVKGEDFAAFAARRIKGSILDSLRRQDHLTRGQRQRYREVCATIRNLSLEHGGSPELSDVAARLEITEIEVREAIDLASNALPLDARNQQGIAYRDAIADSSLPAPDQQADDNLSREAMRAAFQRLDEREQQLLFLKHEQGLRQCEIAAVLGLTEGRVSQIYKEIVVKLRALLGCDEGEF